MFKTYDIFFRAYNKYAKQLYSSFNETPQLFLLNQHTISSFLLRHKKITLIDIYNAIAKTNGSEKWKYFRSHLEENLRHIELCHKKIEQEHRRYRSQQEKVLRQYDIIGKEITLEEITPFPDRYVWLTKNRIECHFMDFRCLDFSLYANDLPNFFSDINWFDFSYCNFAGCRFLNNTFAYAKCCHANFTHTEFCILQISTNQSTTGDFEKSDFSGANCYGANFTGAYMRDANFSNADLRKTNLRNVRGYNIILKNADLRGADMYGADISPHQISQAITDKTTILPNNTSKMR